MVRQFISREIQVFCVSEELELVGDGSSDVTRLRLMCGGVTLATVYGCLNSLKSDNFGNEQSQLKRLTQFTMWSIISWFLVCL